MKFFFYLALVIVLMAAAFWTISALIGLVYWAILAVAIIGVVSAVIWVSLGQRKPTAIRGSSAMARAEKAADRKLKELEREAENKRKSV